MTVSGSLSLSDTTTVAPAGNALAYGQRYFGTSRLCCWACRLLIVYLLTFISRYCSTPWLHPFPRGSKPSGVRRSCLLDEFISRRALLPQVPDNQDLLSLTASMRTLELCKGTDPWATSILGCRYKGAGKPFSPPSLGASAMGCHN